MKKLINGQPLDIGSDVIELFEKGLEGNVTKKMLQTKIDVKVEGSSDEIGEVVSEYYNAYIRFPYPLYAVEDDIKYATIAVQMQRRLPKLIKYCPKVKVGGGKVKVFSDDGYCIELASDNWAIVMEHYDEDDDGKIDIDSYKDSALFRFYKWCLDKMEKSEQLSGFYNFAIPGLLTACNGKPMVVKWELAKLLQFNDVPSQVSIPNRVFIDTSTGSEYMLDMFWEGKYKANPEVKTLVIDLRSDATEKFYDANDEKLYSFEVYDNNRERGRVVLKNSKRLFASIADVIGSVCNEKCLNVDRLEYRGLISEGYIALQVADDIYTGRLDGKTPLSQTGNYVDIVNMSGSKLFVKKSFKKEGAIRQAYYVYDIVSDKLKVCDVNYRKGGADNDNN